LKNINYIKEGDLTLTVTAGQFRKLSAPPVSSGSCGIKKKIKMYTPASLKKLKQTIMSAPHKIKNNPLKMITLTYHHNPESHQEAKRDLDSFMKRLRRLSPESFFIWKLEYQTRGTIHYHILCYNLAFSEDLPARIATAWNEITGQGKAHLQAGTRIETIKKPLYICKYEGKPEKNEYQGTDNPGRFWGIVNRKAYDAAVNKKEINISAEQYKMIKRFIRKQLKKYLKDKTKQADKISRMTNTTIYKVEKMLSLIGIEDETNNNKKNIIQEDERWRKKEKKLLITPPKRQLKKPIKPIQPQFPTHPTRPLKPKYLPIKPVKPEWSPEEIQLTLT
jgi:hypothetical protein